MNKGFTLILIGVILGAVGLIFFMQPGGDQLFSSARPSSSGTTAPNAGPPPEPPADRPAGGTPNASHGGERPSAGASGSENAPGGSGQSAGPSAGTSATGASRAERPGAPESVREADLSPSASHTLRSITLAVAEGDRLVLRIEADDSFPVKTFLLPNPNRLVVDLPGDWTNMKAPSVPQNRLIRSARLGSQSAGPRLVLDLRTQLNNRFVERPDDKTVEIIFE